MLNKYRFVSYEGDGVDVYECLKCGKGWSGRNMWFNYCGHCGTRWDGELKWDTERVFERRGRNSRRVPDLTYVYEFVDRLQFGDSWLHSFRIEHGGRRHHIPVNTANRQEVAATMRRIRAAAEMTKDTGSDFAAYNIYLKVYERSLHHEKREVGEIFVGTIRESW